MAIWPDVGRMREFVSLSRARGEDWYGYDFSGMFGLWNSNLKPDRPGSIGHDYICSTVVVAALYYAGLQLDAIQRGGIADVVTPKQVVTSRGHFIPLPEVEIRLEKGQQTDRPAKK
jgi:hypothetical protein